MAENKREGYLTFPPDAGGKE